MYNQAESMEQYMSIIQCLVLRFGNSERETMPVFVRCFLVHLRMTVAQRDPKHSRRQCDVVDYDRKDDYI